MVIGGNFIHSLHVPMQYRICDIEIETNVSPKFRFPFFEKLNWFVALGALERGQDYLTTLSTKELQGILAVTVHLFNKQRSLKQDVQLIKEERHMIRASIPADATAYANGGVTGLLRDLNQLVLTILEGPGAIRTADSPIEPSLRIMTLEQEQREDEEERKNKPKIKLRIKLNSTASSTNSGDEESLEQQVPGSGASLRHTSASSPTSTNASATTTPTAVPKLKFKLPLLSVAKKPTKKSGRVPKPKKRSDTELYETGNESDLGDDKGEDIFGSDSDRDQQLTSDEEWNEFENQIDEGFDEAKEDEDEDDELEDDGSRADLRSSDSEYDEGVKRHRRSSSTKRMSRPAASSLRQAKKVTVQALTTTLRPHVKQSSSETVYFGEDGDGDYDGSPDYVYRPSKRESDEDEEEEVVLGLGKKRKLTPMQFSALIAPMSSVSGATNSSMTSSTPAKKKAAMGTTAKDRIKNLLMKRR
ncbi:JmjC domain-containing histone demethylation protein 1 [Mortierella claussenii]|nr:JmjC domain-containing histone demethylation protein 1 [Mortierella claussenii]